MSAINLMTFLGKPPGPFTGSVKAKVIATTGTVTYKKSDEDRQSLTVGLADSTGSAKGIIYDPEQFSRFRVGNTVLMRNVILRADRTIVLTRNSRSFLSAAITVTEDHAAAAERLVNPPQAPLLSLQQTLRSPVKTMVTVRGQIVQEDQEREVLVGNSPTRVKDIYLSDTRVRVKVSLWRDACDMAYRPGDYVTITDAITSSHNGQPSLSLTSKSTIQASEPTLEERTVIIEGIGGNDSAKELITSDGEMLQVSSIVLRSALPEDVDIDQYVAQHAPLTVRIYLRGATTERIELQSE